MNWNKMEHDFGQVVNNTTHYTEFIYSGSVDVEKLVAVPLCGCTGIQRAGNVFRVGLNVIGDKISVVRVNYPDGAVEELILKGQGK